ADCHDGIEPVCHAPERIGEAAAGRGAPDERFRVGLGAEPAAVLARLDQGVECEHQRPPSGSVRTTLPFFWPVSTYRWASATSSRGYMRSITGRYSPASMRSFRKRRSCLRMRGGSSNTTFLSPKRLW